MATHDANFTAYFDSAATTPPRDSLDCNPPQSQLPLGTINSRLHRHDDPEMGSASHPDEGIGARGFDDEQERELELEAGYRSPTRAETEKIQAKDPHLVEWDGPDDPENPQNLPVWRKWVITMTLSSLTIWVTFASSVFSEATMATAQEFGVSTEVTTLGTSLPLVGFALGPLIWGPASELYGRKLPLFVGFFCFAIFQIPVAVAQNLETVMLGRFFTGFFGCAPLAIIGGILADIFNTVDRGVAIAFFAAATFGGPTCGPLIGGFVTQSELGWRWTAWLTLIPSAAFGLVALFVVPETYPPALLQRRAARMRLETRNFAYHSLLDENPPTVRDLIVKYMLRPFVMLALEPILLCITIYMALIYAILYLTFEAYPVSFMEERGWKSAGVAALPFLSILVGVFIGSALIIFVTKTRYANKLKKDGYVAPEERLVPMIIGGVFLPIGLFWFGWTSSPHISWVPQVIAGVPIGIGILVIFMQGLNYIIDVYMMFANSAIAANTLVRSALGGGFPLFATQMFHKLGVNWASSLLGFLTAAMVPIPILYWFYGAKLRSMSKFKPQF